MDPNTKRIIDNIDREIKNLQQRKESLIRSINRLHNDDDINKYLQTYAGKDLIGRHKLDERGVWQVNGEDPNCDMGGSHHEPFLGTFEGTLENVIKTAVNIRGFYAWGGGGSIKKVQPPIAV